MPRKTAFARAVEWLQLGSSEASKTTKVYELKDVTSLPENIRRHLTRIMRIFENIDHQILHDLSNISISLGDGSTEDPRVLSLKSYEKIINSGTGVDGGNLVTLCKNTDALRSAIRQTALDQKDVLGLMERLKIVKTHTNDEMFSYLGDHTLLGSWNDKFTTTNVNLGQALSKVGGGGELTHQFSLYSSIYVDISEECAQLELLLEDSNQCLPLDVEAGINARVRALQSFIQSMKITAQNGYSDKTKSDRFLGAQSPSRSPRVHGGRYPTKFQTEELGNLSPSSLKISYQWISVALDSSSISVFFFFAIMIGTALQVAAFAKTPQTMSPGSLSSADFLSVCQQFVWQIFGLYLTIVPALGTDHFSRCFGFWTWSFTGLSVLAGVASLILYTTVSPAACAMAGFAANAAQAFVVLQLVQGIGKIPRTKVTVE